MEENPQSLVSICIPVINTVKYIEEAISLRVGLGCIPLLK